MTIVAVAASSIDVGPGTSVTFTATSSPPPDGGAIELQIDRFDPLSGWQFSKLVRLSAPGGSVTWKPPQQGRWRVRAAFLGTLRYSPSRSGYVFVLVQKPTR